SIISACAGGKADIRETRRQCPLMTHSGHGANNIPQRSSLLPHGRVLSFLSEAGRASSNETARVHRGARQRGGVADGGARATEGLPNWISFCGWRLYIRIILVGFCRSSSRVRLDRRKKPHFRASICR